MPFCLIIPCPHGGAIIMKRISTKDHGGPKCPSVVPFKILHSEGPFEVASFEHFGLEWPFNMAAMIVFSPKCPSEGDISHLERTTIRVSSSIGWYMRGLKYSLALQRHTGQTALLQALIRSYKIKRLFNYKNYLSIFILFFYCGQCQYFFLIVPALVNSNSIYSSAHIVLEPKVFHRCWKAHQLAKGDWLVEPWTGAPAPMAKRAITLPPEKHHWPWRLGTENFIYTQVSIQFAAAATRTLQSSLTTVSKSRELNQRQQETKRVRLRALQMRVQTGKK